MADDPNRASKDSRKSFLSSFDDVDKFLEASESVEDDPNSKTADIEITTDLSCSLQSPTSPMPFLSRSMDGKSPKIHDPIAEEELSDAASPAPLPHTDTPLPNPDDVQISEVTENSDELTVHEQSDSISTEALKLMAGIKSSEISTSRQQEIRPVETIEVNVDQPTTTTESDVVQPSVPVAAGSNLIDKVSFMESSAQNNNNTLMATGASLADLPFEEDNQQSRKESPLDMLSEQSKEASSSATKMSEVEEEVDKILKEVKGSEREYSSDEFESAEDEEELSSEEVRQPPPDLKLDTSPKSPEKDYLLKPESGLNPFESTPINMDRSTDQSAGFDLSPVKPAPKTELEEGTEPAVADGNNSNTLSTTNPDYSQERDMAYYLAKIKAKAAQKSQELRSSIENSRASGSGVESDKTSDFVKPKTPLPKKKHVVKKATVGSKPVISKRQNVSKLPGPKASKSRIVAESPVAAYIKGKQKGPRIITDSKDIKEISKSKLGNTWTCALSDKSLVEVIQSDGDVEAWKELYKRTQDELRTVQNQLQDLEDSYQARVANLKTAHSQELHKYKQEIYVLQSRVKTSSEAAAGDTPGDERVARLSKQVSELEKLLEGYQSENVKLYDEVKGIKQDHKDEITRLFHENQDLATDNVALKQILEQKEATIRQLHQKQQSQQLSDKVSNLPKLVSLQTELDGMKRQEILYKQRIAVLEGSEDRRVTDAAVNSSIHHVDKEVTTLIKEHAQERDDLYGKLETLLLENSQLKTDRDLLQRRDERIAELQQTIKSLRSVEHEQRLVSKATTESDKTIKDLKRQVAEVESALRKRHPDSIAALIAATNTGPDYSDKILELQETLKKVKLDHEGQIEKLKLETNDNTELSKVGLINKMLQEKVLMLEQSLSERNIDYGKLVTELEELREGQIPTGEIKRKMELLNDKLRLQDEEMVQLKSRLLLAPKQYNPEQFEGKHVSEIRKENSILSTRCDLLKIENDQNKSTLLGLKLTQEAELVRLSEDHAHKMDKLLLHHEEDRQRLILDHAAKFAGSEAGRMKSRVETLGLQVEHYSELAARLPKVQAELAGLKGKERVLEEQITKLARDLEEAAAEQPPTIHQYKSIQQRVQNMEQAHNHQILQLQNTIDSLEKDKVKVIVADDHIVKKYKAQLIEKNLQIEKFQSEIDSIITLCMELQEYGLVLPKRSRLGQINRI